MKTLLTIAVKEKDGLLGFEVDYKNKITRKEYLKVRRLLEAF